MYSQQFFSFLFVYLFLKSKSKLTVVYVAWSSQCQLCPTHLALGTVKYLGRQWLMSISVACAPTVALCCFYVDTPIPFLHHLPEAGTFGSVSWLSMGSC